VLFRSARSLYTGASNPSSTKLHGGTQPIHGSFIYSTPGFKMAARAIPDSTAAHVTSMQAPLQNSTAAIQLHLYVRLQDGRRHSLRTGAIQSTRPPTWPLCQAPRGHKPSLYTIAMGPYSTNIHGARPIPPLPNSTGAHSQ
jgi:hypothetical protein